MRPPLSRTLFDTVREWAERTPDAPAVIAGDDTVSFAALLGRASRIGAGLRRRGIGRGDRVGVLLGNGMAWIETALGIGAAGATVVPFSTWSTRQELAFLLPDSGIRLLVAAARLGDRDLAADLAALCPDGRDPDDCPALEAILLVGGTPGSPFPSADDLAEDATGEDGPPGVTASGMDDGLVLYTSGSSAHPKAVRLVSAGIVENGFNIGERMGLTERDRVFLPAPLFWSYGAANALPATLTHGAALVLQERFEPAGAITLIERHRCTALYTLPGMTGAMIRHPDFAPERVATLRTGLTIGAPQDLMEVAEGLGAREICNIYGATETYGNCCVTPHDWPLEQRALCQGPPLPGNRLRFVDVETGVEVPDGEPGLTEVRGYVTAGYSGASAENNAAAFTPDGYYRTGDVGRRDENGSFVFVGRNTEMIKRAGINVSPAEVENVLLLHPSVAQAGVVGTPDRERGELVIAFVVAREPVGSADLVADLLAHCRSVASKYKVPDRIEIRTALPHTPTGKLQRRELKQDAADLVAGPSRG